jgi:hypothetical protein
MWRALLELCANVFGATRRPRSALVIVTVFVMLLMTGVLGIRWGPRGLVPIAFLAVTVAAAARDVFAARDAAWRAALLPLEHPRQRPSWAGDERFTAPSAVALRNLAASVDAARRGQYLEASQHVAVVDRALLRPEELQLVEAVRALISLGLGDENLTAQHALGALPTGSDDIDACLGRTLVRHAWSSGERLAAIDRAWARGGVLSTGDGALPRLRQLLRLRIDGASALRLPTERALLLADEARAIGDEEFAAHLESRARQSGAYR